MPTDNKKYICVFCGSSDDAPYHHKKAAQELGQTIVNQGYGLVYGGGNVGLMKVLADSVKNAGGDVIGVIIPEVNTPKQGITILKEKTYPQRITKMMELSVGFIVLPGGIGTLYELVTVIHAQSINKNTPVKPFVLFNVGVDNFNFYDRLAGHFAQSEEDTFIKTLIAEMVYFTKPKETPEDAVRYIARFENPKANVLIHRKKPSEEKIALQNKPRPWLTSTTLLAGAGAFLIGLGIFTLKRFSKDGSFSGNSAAPKFIK